MGSNASVAKELCESKPYTDEAHSQPAGREGMVSAVWSQLAKLVLVAHFGAVMAVGVAHAADNNSIHRHDSTEGPKLEEQTIDHYVPVVSMEQTGPLLGRLQAYRVQLFRDGRVIYQGFRDVATLGERQHVVNASEVESLLVKIGGLAFWEAPENQYGVPRSLSPMGWVFTVRSGDTTKTLRIDGRSFSMALLRQVEGVAKTDRWRCPYKNFMQEELCSEMVKLVRSMADKYERSLRTTAEGGKR